MVQVEKCKDTSFSVAPANACSALSRVERVHPAGSAGGVTLKLFQPGLLLNRKFPVPLVRVVKGSKEESKDPPSENGGKRQ
jgi:hypothetical protein